MDERQLMKFKVPELKEKLLALGIQPKGLKADLVRQLLQAHEQSQQQSYLMQQQMQFQQSQLLQQQQQLQLQQPDPQQQQFNSFVPNFEMPQHCEQNDGINLSAQFEQQQQIYQQQPQQFTDPMNTLSEEQINIAIQAQEQLNRQQAEAEQLLLQQKMSEQSLDLQQFEQMQQQEQQQQFAQQAFQQQQTDEIFQSSLSQQQQQNQLQNYDNIPIENVKDQIPQDYQQQYQQEVMLGEEVAQQQQHFAEVQDTVVEEQNVFAQEPESSSVETSESSEAVGNEISENSNSEEQFGIEENQQQLQQPQQQDYVDNTEDSLVNADEDSQSQVSPSNDLDAGQQDEEEEAVHTQAEKHLDHDADADPAQAVADVVDNANNEEESADEHEDQENVNIPNSYVEQIEIPTLDEAELAKMSKNQRRKYKKKLRNKVKRIERNQIEVRKKEWNKETLEQQRLIEEKLKFEQKKWDIEEEEAAAAASAVSMDIDEDRMDIDEEDEAEDEKERRKKIEEEMVLKRKLEQEKRERSKEIILKELENKVEIEWVPEDLPKDRFYLQYLKVFDKFSAVSSAEASRLEAEQKAETNKNRDDRLKLLDLKKPVELELKDEDEKDEGGLKMSKRKMKQMLRMNISVLKQRVSHPELVEMHDVTAKDPVLLLYLKSTRNTVPVPRHWCYKRKYLQGKRGFEKPPFKLPEFIRRTGIQEMREAVAEKEDSKSLKNKMREKIRPKMGKIDIDYQKLHDAFFKWQTKPKMTIHGDLYYEGKEFETRLKDKKPGDLSNELRAALGMPTGPNAQKCPPPWLIAMQRYGPPPSYPNMKIPGLNAPIPDGCSFGYHAGGWGKPPVDEYGRPLYGDVFGEVAGNGGEMHIVEEQVDQSKWGALEEDESEESEEEEEEGEEGEGEEEGEGAEAAKASGLVTPALGHEGLATPSGMATITGLETPDLVELRKRKQIEAEMESGDNPQLFTVVPEKKADKFGKDMMGSMHVYDFASLSKSSGSKASSSRNDGVEVTLDPSELESGQMLDSYQMEKRYEQTLREQSSGNPHEDLSDMVAEYNAKKRKKEKDNKAKKYQFKF